MTVRAMAVARGDEPSQHEILTHLGGMIDACVATGDLQTAEIVLGRLTERHERLARPWTTLGVARSRALLASASGADASAALDEMAAATAAVAAFTALGAGAFAERARTELARVGGRPPAPRELTATELRVARLAAQGRTNRMVADELFLSRRPSRRSWPGCTANSASPAGPNSAR